MIVLASAICCLVQPSTFTDVTWQTLRDSKPGKWEAKAVYPELKPTSELALYFNQEVKRQVAALYYEAVLDLTKQKVSYAKFELKSTLGMMNDKLSSVLFSVERPGFPVELSSVTCWLSGSQPLNCVWSSIFSPSTNADQFSQSTLLPALNEVRKSNGLAEIPNIPAGLLDKFVVSQSNVCWLAPPGLAGLNGTQVKVSISKLADLLNQSGPLGTGEKPKQPNEVSQPNTMTVPVNILVQWSLRDNFPRGASLQTSLYRQKDDPLPLSSYSIPVTDPPVEVKYDFTNIKVLPDDRLYLDIRIVAAGKTYFRNKEVIRIPALGWQTVHKIVLEVERQ